MVVERVVELDTLQHELRGKKRKLSLKTLKMSIYLVMKCVHLHYELVVVIIHLSNQHIKV